MSPSTLQWWLVGGIPGRAPPDNEKLLRMTKARVARGRALEDVKEKRRKSMARQRSESEARKTAAKVAGVGLAAGLPWLFGLGPEYGVVVRAKSAGAASGLAGDIDGAGHGGDANGGAEAAAAPAAVPDEQAPPPAPRPGPAVAAEPADHGNGEGNEAPPPPQDPGVPALQAHDYLPPNRPLPDPPRPPTPAEVAPAPAPLALPDPDGGPYPPPPDRPPPPPPVQDNPLPAPAPAPIGIIRGVPRRTSASGDDGLSPAPEVLPVWGAFSIRSSVRPQGRRMERGLGRGVCKLDGYGREYAFGRVSVDVRG